MPRNSTIRLQLGAGVAAIALCAGAIPAAAQDTQNTQVPPSVGDAQTQPSEGDASDIVVTGTLLRGVAPTGTNVVSLSSEAITQSGATSTNQVLSRIPQVTSAFNRTPALSATDGGNSVIRPNLRNLGAAGGNTTLILVDGHRQVNAGILITSPDPDVIPPAVLERVDVVPDGGSSIYGSDAVGGVINFITKKRFDGVQVDARYGHAADFDSFDGNLTVGRAWQSGSAYLSAGVLKSDAILGRDRDYVRQISANAGYCAPGTVFVARGATPTSYALPNRTAGTLSQCDNTDALSIFPSVERVSLFSVFNQELTNSVSLDIRGYYTRRVSNNYRDFNAPGDYAQSVTITPANPFYVPIAPDPGSQTVNFSYAGLASNKIENVLEEFGVTPTLTADLGGGWEARLLGNFQRSTVTTRTPQFDGAAQTRALAGTSTDTALNPYDPGSTNRSVLDSILGEEYAYARQNLTNVRGILDGSIASLPGGDLHVAVGAEYIRESLNNLIRGTFRGGTDVARNVGSVFGEVAVPVVGAGNAFEGVQSLILSASGRYDHYSDFGSTFNPKLGATYRPFRDLAIRGNWGRSFNAPSLADKDGAPDTRAILITVSPFRDPADPASDFNRGSILIAGGNANLKAQKAETWSVGFDFTPAAIEGLKLSATLYNISLTNTIGVIPFTANPFTPTYAAYYIKNPTFAQANAIVGDLPIAGNATSLAQLYGGPNGDPYVLLDLRRQNLGLLKQRGIDFVGSYTRPTDFGSIMLSSGGTYTLRRKTSGGVGVPFVNEFDTPGASRFNLLSSLGATVGDGTATLTWTHTAGYRINPSIGTQSRIEGFDTIDLFVGYDLKTAGVLKDTSITLNLSNIFDAAPPYYNLDPGFTNGSTYGRLIQLGISKRF